jgi:hypothetical protein
VSKAILLSIIIAIIAIPTHAARRGTARAGLRKVLVRLLFFAAFYAFALLFLYGRL